MYRLYVNPTPDLIILDPNRLIIVPTENFEKRIADHIANHYTWDDVNKKMTLVVDFS